MNDDAVYIVSSFHRSGSSMMMACLIAGGFIPNYSITAERDLAAPTFNGYSPNPNGFYQYGKQITDSFYNENKGRLVKVYALDLKKLPKGTYKIVFMLRDSNEIRASMHAWTPCIAWGREERATYFTEEIISAINTLGLDITFLNYADVVSNPKAELGKLVGWGLDVQKASAQVDPALRRLNLEKK